MHLVLEHYHMDTCVMFCSHTYGQITSRMDKCPPHKCRKHPHATLVLAKKIHNNSNTEPSLQGTLLGSSLYHSNHYSCYILLALCTTYGTPSPAEHAAFAALWDPQDPIEAFSTNWKIVMWLPSLQIHCTQLTSSSPA